MAAQARPSRYWPQHSTHGVGWCACYSRHRPMPLSCGERGGSTSSGRPRFLHSSLKQAMNFESPSPARSRCRAAPRPRAAAACARSTCSAPPLGADSASASVNRRRTASMASGSFSRHSASGSSVSSTHTFRVERRVLCGHPHVRSPMLFTNTHGYRTVAPRTPRRLRPEGADPAQKVAKHIAIH